MAGRAQAVWMPTARLKALLRAGVPFAEIAKLNKELGGSKVSVAAVSKKARALGFGPRRLSHAGIVPRGILPEHNQSQFRYMLQAGSKRLQGEKLSPTDARLCRALDRLLAAVDEEAPLGRIIVYDRSTPEGWWLVPRLASDGDNLIRLPPDIADSEPLGNEG